MPQRNLIALLIGAALLYFLYWKNNTVSTNALPVANQAGLGNPGGLGIRATSNLEYGTGIVF